MSLRYLFGLCVAVCAVALIVACSSPTPTPAPTPTVVKPTPLPAPTPIPSSENCIKCHTNQETLKKIAVDKVEKSEATEGEG